MRAALRRLDGVVDTAAATAAWEDALRQPQWAGDPVWTHSDLLPGNLLVADGRLSAVIDFGGAGVGDPACDAMPAWTALPAEVRDEFRAAVRMDDASWARGRGWVLCMGLVAAPYYRDSDPAFAALALAAVREVLIDLGLIDCG